VWAFHFLLSINLMTTISDNIAKMGYIIDSRGLGMSIAYF
jgi:hypothetical protein